MRSPNRCTGVRGWSSASDCSRLAFATIGRDRAQPFLQGAKQCFSLFHDDQDDCVSAIRRNPVRASKLTSELVSR